MILPHPIMPQLEKILSIETNAEHRFIPDYAELEQVITELRSQGKKIVLTQGVYDLIHQGHAIYLQKAREHGDVLIVGVDSDALTKQRKGPDRPIVPQEERVNMLIHLRHVDIVTIRDIHHGIGGLIRLVQPDILIVSESTKDFQGKDVEEYENACGKIVMLPPQATTSTTERVRNLTIEGAKKLAHEIGKLTEDFISKIKG